MGGKQTVTQEVLFDCRPCAEPVLVSACFFGIPCRWHGRRKKLRRKLLERLKKRYVLVPVCPEQLGGLPTPRRTGEQLFGTGAQVLDEGLKMISPVTGKDMTHYYINGSNYIVEMAEIIGAKRAYLKGGSPACDKEGITGEILRRAEIRVIRVP